MINTIQYTGDNQSEIWNVFGTAGIYGVTETNPDYLILTTVSGDPVPCRKGDWIIADGEPNTFYPCTDKEFKLRYEDPEQPHAWPDTGVHFWGPFQAYSRIKKYRVCLHPGCHEVDYWDVPKGV